MTVVVDASVILKWLLEDPTKEPDTETALALIDAVIHGKPEILQPVHWLIEVAAVAARLTPRTASADDAVLVTTDDRYRRKAKHHGMITALANWENVT